MPWSPRDADAFTKKANTPRKKKIWAAVANQSLHSGDDEATAVRKANAAVKGKKR